VRLFNPRANSLYRSSGKDKPSGRSPLPRTFQGMPERPPHCDRPPTFQGSAIRNPSRGGGQKSAVSHQQRARGRPGVLFDLTFPPKPLKRPHRPLAFTRSNSKPGPGARPARPRPPSSSPGPRRQPRGHHLLSQATRWPPAVRSPDRPPRPRQRPRTGRPRASFKLPRRSRSMWPPWALHRPGPGSISTARSVPRLQPRPASDARKPHASIVPRRIPRIFRPRLDHRPEFDPPWPPGEPRPRSASPAFKSVDRLRCLQPSFVSL